MNIYLVPNGSAHAYLVDDQGSVLDTLKLRPLHNAQELPKLAKFKNVYTFFGPIRRSNTLNAGRSHNQNEAILKLYREWHVANYNNLPG